MTRWFASACIAVAFLAATQRPAVAKGPVDGIVIRGGGLQTPVWITERSALRDFDPWSGRFIDWARDTAAGPVVAAPDRAHSYEVLFYLRWPQRHSKYDRDGLALIYDVRYAPGTGDDPGFVYLPADDDPYHVNSGTIERDGKDGSWHRASPAWAAFVSRLTATVPRT